MPKKMRREQITDSNKYLVSIWFSFWLDLFLFNLVRVGGIVVVIAFVVLRRRGRHVHNPLIGSVQRVIHCGEQITRR
jgi:hypothetical protein